MLGALRHRNYRLFFGGQIVSLVGTWMQSIAQPWLVLQLTHSALAVGLVIAAQFTPVLVLGQFGGLVADRFPKRRILILTQSAFVLPALFLFAVTELHVAQVWMPFVAALLVGCINVFDVPARQAFVIEMVGREDLVNAIALNSSVFNGASVVGPSVAGVLIAALGVSLCFLANSISYFGAIAALLLMRNLPAVVRRVDNLSAWQRLREGARYALRDPVVGMMLLAVSVFSLFAMNRLTLVPLFAEDILHMGASGFGFLMAALGLGAMTGALSLAYLADRGASGRRQFLFGVLWTLALLGFSMSRTFVLSAALLFVAGFCQMTFIAIANTRIQTATPDHLRGRVMAIYAQAMMGVTPFGSAGAGILASLWGPAWAMAIGAMIAGAVVIGIRIARPEVFEAAS